MARLAATPLSDRILRLQEQAEEVRAELEKLRKEEAYLREQTEKAEGQLAYYEELLKDLKRRTQRRKPLHDVIGRL